MLRVNIAVYRQKQVIKVLEGIRCEFHDIVSVIKPVKRLYGPRVKLMHLVPGMSSNELTGNVVSGQ